MMFFERNIYKEMLKWKDRSQGKTALLIEGARRIGKSTIVKEFAEKEYESYIFIDFGDTKNSFTKNVKKIFETSENYDEFFSMLEVAFSTKLIPRKSVIVFDEIQKYIPAREMIKYLIQDGRYSYIETGSLISLKKNSRRILIPSEEEKIEMFSLSFDEFLKSCGEELLLHEIQEHYNSLTPLKDPIHTKAMRLFRTYMAVGGMPQAVETYLVTKDFEQVDQVKKGIIQLYCEDLEKISRKSSAITPLIIYDHIQSLFSNHSFEITPTDFSPNTKLYTCLNNVDELEKSKVVHIAYDLVNVDPTLSLGFDMNGLKVYSADTGLLITKMYPETPYVENELYKSIILDKLSVNEGFLFENIVAQMLRSSGHSLKYNSFYKSESQNKYYIDFLIGKKGKIYPIEVKSSSYRCHASLDEFSRKYHDIIGTSYVIYSKNLQVEEKLIYLPIYMTFCL